jgi:hypothetical protein
MARYRRRASASNYNPRSRHNKWSHASTPAPEAQPEANDAATEIVRKIGKNRGKSRLWIEGQALIDAGWQVGDRFNIVYDGDNIRYERNPEGKRKVAGTPTRPIIDTNSDAIKDAVGDDRVTVSLTNGIISIVKKITAAIAIAVSLVASFFASPAPASQPQVLIACEESGVIRDAFKRHGIHAVSCDIDYDSRTDNDRHYRGDVRDILHAQEWDLIVGHPPCDSLALSGVRWHQSHWVKAKDCKPNADGKWYHPRLDGGRGGWVDARPGEWLWTEEKAAAKRADRDFGLDFFRLLWNAPAKRIALEQPRSLVSTHVEKKTQAIHPWQFGHGVRKETWLWLKNLPPLVPTNVVSGRSKEIWYAAPGVDRAKERSKTFDGIGEAIASQWAPLLLK